MKKFELLGRSLSKNEQKKIKGGDETVELGGEGGGAICVSCGNNHTLCTSCPNGGLGLNYYGIECNGGGKVLC